MKGRNALMMASRDMASASKTESPESPVVKDMNQERLSSAYDCSISMSEHGMLNVISSVQYS